MSANPQSVVHTRQISDGEKSKDEQPRKSEPGVKGMVSRSVEEFVLVLVFSEGHSMRRRGISMLVSIIGALAGTQTSFRSVLAKF